MNVIDAAAGRRSHQMDKADLTVTAPFNISIWTQTEACWKVTVMILFLHLPKCKMCCHELG
jgi:hypothetical protein